MTMYYSRAEMDYVEDQRMREMQDIAEGKVELAKDEDGVFRLRRKLGETRDVLGK